MALPDELQDLAAKVSNWGRWGDDDQRGTLNLIDDAAVLRGVAAVRDGPGVLARDPVRRERPAWTGEHARPRQPELRQLHGQRRVHRRPRRLHHERRLVPHGRRRRRRTGTRSPTSATRASSTTACPTRWCPRRGAQRLGIEHFGAGRDARRAARHRPAARRRPLRRQLRDHRRRSRRAAAAAGRRGRARRRGARPHRADALPPRGDKRALLDAVARDCRPVDRVDPRPRRRRRRHRHADVRGLPCEDPTRASCRCT